MNNIKQKNVIYGRDQKDVLPHGGKGDSVAFSQNSNITDARVNNALQQLLNNDLYLENRLALEMGYRPGPVRPDGAEAEAALPDGAKTWSDSGDYLSPLTVYRKVEAPLSASVSKERAGKVVFMAPVGDAVFVAFSDGLMYDEGDGLRECLDPDGRSVVATGYWTGDAGTLFASDSLVYQLAKTYGEDEEAYMLRPVEMEPTAGIRCLSYDAASETLYVGGDGVLARGRYRFADSSRMTASSGAVQLTSDVKFSMDEQWGSDHDSGRYAQGVVVNALQLLDASDPSVNARGAGLLAATGSGVYRSEDRDFLLASDAPAFRGGTCGDLAVRAGAVYVLCDGRLYRQSGGMDFEQVTWGEDGEECEFQNATSLVSHSSGLYVGCADGVYRMAQPGDEPALELPLQGGPAAVAVESLFHDRLVFAANGSAVYYYQNPADVRSFDLGGDWTVSELAVQPRAGVAGAFDVYAIASGEDGESRVFAAHMRFGREPVPDSGRVYGMDKVAEACAGAAGAAGTCWYAKGCDVYDAQSGRRVGLQGMRALCLESFPGGRLAAGADIGLAVLDPASGEMESQVVDLQNVRRVAHSDGLLYLASGREVRAAVSAAGDLDSSLVGEAPEGHEFDGLGASSGHVFALLDDGRLLDSTAYRTLPADSTLSVVDGDEDEPPDAEDLAGAAVDGWLNAAPMGFPVMPYMEEINSEEAVGLSDGAVYGLTYADGCSCGPVRIGGLTADVDAFCKVGPQFFVAAGGRVYQYSTSSDSDDLTLSDLPMLSPADQADVPGVRALAYSGTDVTFDMRVYAQGETGLSVYRPELSSDKRISCGAGFDDFVMYIDVHGEDENHETYYAVLAAAGADGLSVSTSEISGGS